MKSKFKKIIGVCLSMILTCSLSLPVYAKQPDYEFDKQTGHLTIKDGVTCIDECKFNRAVGV